MSLNFEGSNPGGTETFHTRPDRPLGTQNLLYNRHQVSRWGKAAGAWRKQLTPSSAEVKEMVELYIYSPSVSSWGPG